MANLIGGLPETDELVRWLQEQKKLPRSYSTPYKSVGTGGVPSRMMGDPQTPAQASARLAPAEAEGAGVLSQLQGAAPKGGGLLTSAILTALGGPAVSFGHDLGEKYLAATGGRTLQDFGPADYAHLTRAPEGGLPSVDQVMASPGSGVGNLPFAQMASGPTRPMKNVTPVSPQSATVAALSGAPSIKFETPRTPEEEVEQPDETTPGAEVAEDAAPAQTLDQQIATLLSNKQDVPTESPSLASSQALAELSQPKAVAPDKGGIGRALKRFFVAGSGPLDFTRLDRQELALANDQQAFNDRDKLRAEMAAKDVGGAQDFNRKAKLHSFEQGGMTPQDEFQLKMLEGDRSFGQKSAHDTEMAGLEHTNRMAEIGANAANQKLSPEQVKATNAAKMLQEYPDLFTPEQIMAETGLQTNPQALQVIANARKKSDVMDNLLLMMMQQKGLVPGGAPAAGRGPAPASPAAQPNLNLRALQTK